MTTPTRIEELAVADLVPYARNAKKHPPAQVAQIAASIREFGFTVPVLVDASSGIIAGHGRVLAARKLGMATVPAIRIAHLTELQKRAYILADNKLTESGWDGEILAAELQELLRAGVDLDVAGFSKAEVGELLGALGGAGLTDPDDAPPVPEQVRSALGDVWLLGSHRLACGDCTNPETVAALLGSETPHLMVTDPPYGVEYVPEWRHDKGINNSGRRGKVDNDDRADWREAWELFPGDVAYVWHSGLYASTVEQSLIAAGLLTRAQVVWAKEHLVFGRGHYHWQHEACWYSVRKGVAGHWSGGRKQSTLWTISTRQERETVHGTQKPVECMRRPILNNSAPGQGVYEPFSGSGTTIIAGEMTGRAVFALEMNPAYVDLGVRRWQEFTGKKAVRESDGMEFDAVEAQ